MKDLSLSLLSRGCGRLVSSNRNTGRHDGRLDVCFTPQDYYIWKSQESLLRLSNSGRLLVAAESTLPKTYSTRRGPLLLYSQDLVTVETNCESEPGNRKKRVVRRYTQQVEQQLSTLKELTAAILNYSNNQYTSSRVAPPLFLPLHFPPVPDLHCPSPLPIRLTRAQASPELLVQLNTQWLPAEENPEQLEHQPEDKEEQPGSRDRIRLDLFLQIPCTSRTPTPRLEPQPWVHYVAMTPEEPEDVQTYSNISLQHSESSQYAEINHHSTGGELQHPNMKCVRDVADDPGCSVRRNSRTTGDKGNYERLLSGSRNGRTVKLCGVEQQSNTEPETNTTSGLFLPPLKVGHSGCCLPSREKTDRLKWERSDSEEHRCAPCLPPIAESCTVAPAGMIHTQTQQDAQPLAHRDGFQSQKENVTRLHQQPLFLPLLFPEKEEEISGKQRGGRDKKDFKKQTTGQEGAGGGGGGGGRIPSEKGSVILLEPGEEPPAPVGVLGCVAGRKGPGKQSSLAFLQNRQLDLQDSCESGEANRSVVRGVLPLELRDLQDGRSVGSLILGPDGEIIQLSLYDNRQDPSEGDELTQQQALQVLSTEGEKLPWVIVLQPEHTHTDGGVELNTDVLLGNIQHHQPMQKRTESHMSFGQFLTGEHGFSTEQFLDRHTSTETNAFSPTSHGDTGAVTDKKTKSAEAVMGTWTKPKGGAKNNVRMPPLKEWVRKEEPRGGDAEAEEEEEEEEQATSGRTSHLSESNQAGQQNISTTEATTGEAVDRRRKNIKRKDPEEAAVSTGYRDMKTGKTAGSDGQNNASTSNEGRWQRQKAEGNSQPIRSQKQEARTNREAAETQDNSALPSVKKKTRDREGERGEVKMNEEREVQGGEAAIQKDVSAGRRRRMKGRLKSKELVFGNHEGPMAVDEVDINEGVEEDSHLKSTRWPSATEKHNSKTKAKSEEDTERDHISTKSSSIQSVSSLRSSNAASQANQRSSGRSAASSCEGAVPTSAMGLASARGRLSSCSTVMVIDEQLMLNPVKPEFSMPRKSKSEEEEEAAALRLAQRAERRRQEVERKRREREEEERKQQEREQTEEKMKSELEGERRKRAEELRMKKLAEEEERRKHEEEEQELVRREQAQRERERRRQEERRRQMERLQKMREEEEQRRKAELERLQLEEQRRQEEENKKLQEMDESERIEYLHRKEQEEEDRRNKEEECKRREEEAASWAAEEARLQAELLAREMALLQQQLAFKRGLVLEAGGLEKAQGISRPWIYSYFTLLQLLGLNPSKAETTT